MWIKCKAAVSDQEEIEDPLLRSLQQDDDFEWRDYCFNANQVKDFFRSHLDGCINIFDYDNNPLTIKYDFDEMYEIKQQQEGIVTFTP